MTATSILGDQAIVVGETIARPWGLGFSPPGVASYDASADIPPTALDAKDFASIDAWLDACIAQGVAGKIGSGDYVVDGLPRYAPIGIYGYGDTPPRFIAQNIDCWLYIKDSGLTLKGLSFEGFGQVAAGIVPLAQGHPHHSLTEDFTRFLTKAQGGTGLAMQWTGSAAGPIVDISDNHFIDNQSVFVFVSDSLAMGPMAFNNNIATGTFGLVDINSLGWSQFYASGNEWAYAIGDRVQPNARTNTYQTAFKIGQEASNQSGTPTKLNIENNFAHDIESVGSFADINAAVFADVRGAHSAQRGDNTISFNEIVHVKGLLGQEDANAIYVKAAGLIVEGNRLSDVGADYVDEVRNGSEASAILAKPTAGGGRDIEVIGNLFEDMPIASQPGSVDLAVVKFSEILGDSAVSFNRFVRTGSLSDNVAAGIIRIYAEVEKTSVIGNQFVDTVLGPSSNVIEFNDMNNRSTNLVEVSNNQASLTDGQYSSDLTLVSFSGRLSNVSVTSGHNQLEGGYKILLTKPGLETAPVSQYVAPSVSAQASDPVSAPEVSVVESLVPGQVLLTLVSHEAAFNRFVLLDEDGGRLALSGAQLKVGSAGLDYEASSKVAGLVRAYAADGRHFDLLVGVGVRDVNEKPSGVVLTNVLTSLPENSSISPGVKVADLAIIDDALGAEVIGLRGADGAVFEVRNGPAGLELYFVGASPNFEAKGHYDLEIVLDDPALGDARDATTPFSLKVGDVDESKAPQAGAAGADTLIGTAAAETLSGGDGSDWIDGGAGDDVLYGFGQEDLSAESGVIQAERIVSGLSGPLFAASPPGDLNRLFVVEQHTGKILVVDLQTKAVTGAFLDLVDSELGTGSEQGLLGLAFHPDYQANGKLYVSLTAVSGATQIWQYSRGLDGLSVDPSSKTLIMSFDRPLPNHNGGWIGFGPDGFLYLASGDGGGEGDPNDLSQNIDSLMGKILRIDVDHDGFIADPSRNYAIPASNPFVGVAGADEIWALGVRNPWRMSFDSQTGDLYIADVGQAVQEEVNYVPAGQGSGWNFGWNLREGDVAYLDGGDPPGLTDPIIVYGHGSGPDLGGSVTGGYVQRGPGGLAGQYIYGDFINGNIWSARVVDGEAQDVTSRKGQLKADLGNINLIASFAQDGLGRLYTVELDGEIHRLNFSAAAGDGADVLRGGAGADRLYGGAGADSLYGGDGDDQIAGGLGNDQLYGGLGGRDRFVFAGAFGADTVFDYDALQDVLDFTGSGLSLAQIVLSQSGSDALVTTSLGTLKVLGRLVGDLVIETGQAPPPATVLDITLSAQVAAENSAAGVMVGSLSTTTSGTNTSFSYQLTDDAGGRFAIAAGKLVTTATALNFEAAASHSVTLKVTDGLGVSHLETFVIQVTDVNEAPSDVTFSNLVASLAENSNVTGGVRVADIAISDDALGSEVLALGGADAAHFQIRTALGVTSLYYVGPSPDFETKASYGVSVLVNDAAVGASPDVSRAFSLSITDVTEGAPPPAPAGPTEGDDKGAGALVGTSSANSINGLGGSDELYGLGGDDALYGGLGDDVLIGGTGKDLLDGGAGIDTASYATAAGPLRADLAYPTKSTGDALGDSFVSIENLIGSDFNDSLGGNNSSNSLWGGAGDDSLGGLGGSDRLYGGDGNDVLLGQGGNDILEGGAGNDSLSSGLGSKDWYVFRSAFGSDTVLDYDAKLDVLDFKGSGLTKAQITAVQSGSDVLVSSALGSIRVVGALVANLVIEADASSTGPVPPPAATVLDIALSAQVAAENSAAGVTVGSLSTTTSGTNTSFSYQLTDDAGGRFAIAAGKLVTTATALNFEAAASHSVTLKVTDGLGVSHLETFVIQVTDVNEAPSDVTFSNLVASLAENSNVTGGVRVADIAISDDALGSEVLALGGADAAHFQIRTALGVTSLYYVGPSPDFETKASYGVSVLVNDAAVGASPDVSRAFSLSITDVTEGAPPPAPAGPTEGDDKGAGALVGTSSANSINGLGGSDELYGLGGDDALYGGLGDDVLIGGTGKDLLDGGAGIDTASYATAAGPLRADLAYPTKSTGDALGDSFVSIENLIGSDFNDSLGGNNSSNSLWGGAGDDSLGGLGGSDRLYGGDGNDALLGQGGNDILEGGAGNDSLNGGLGSRDWFVFAGAWGADTIIDFEKGVDLIDLRGNGLSLGELTIVQQGANVLISSAEFGASILVNNQTAASFALGDFLF